MIYAVSIIGVSTFGIKEFFKYRTKVKKTQAKEEEIDTKNQIFTEFEKLCENAPSIKMQLDSEIANLRSKGATDNQLGSLIFKKQIVDLVAMNPNIAKMVGSPLIQTGMKILAKLPKSIGGIIGV